MEHGLSEFVTQTLAFDLSPTQLQSLLGACNAHINQLKTRFDVKISQHQGEFILHGMPVNVQNASAALSEMLTHAQSQTLDAHAVHLIVQMHQGANQAPKERLHIHTKKGAIAARGANQNDYVRGILTHDVTFGVGPAGTGKTYLAVAAAVEMLQKNEIERILLVRPAVEAGEKLGFLPGDLTQKIDPYLRPLYDALYEMLGFEKVGKLLERQVIEIAPLAYMRGRTLNASFVILDEAQNTTPEQMKMFLTRLGFGSRAVITGDVTQVDLPRGVKSGLKVALDILSGIEDIHVTRFDSRDVVRHHLVQKIVEAYDAYDAQKDA